MKIIKKVKLLLTVITITLILMGIAYAAWADELVAGGTVATGEVNVEYTKDMLFIPYTEPPGLLSGESAISFDRKKVTLTLDNLYPGHPGFRLHTEKENKGSIPVRLNEAVLNFADPQNPAISYLEARLDVGFSEYPGATLKGISDITEDWFPLVELADRINASVQLQNVVLDTGGIISLGMADEYGHPQCLHIRLQENAPNETQGQTVEFTLEMIFIQWNK